SLWSRGRDDRPQAVASHQTALAIYDLSDLLPTKNHLTVPLSFRKAAPKGVVLHRAELTTGDIQEYEGFWVTTPLRTLVDAASDASVGAEHVERAIAQALARGMVRKASLEQALARHQSAAILLNGQ